MIDTIKITIRGSRCEAYANLIRAAIERGPKDYPISTVRNLSEHTHVEIVTESKAPKMAV